MSTLQRRALKFGSFDEILAEVERLQKDGYQQLGKWNLSQTCRHLNDWMTFPLDGFPKPPLPIQWMLTLMKVTIGKRKFKQILASGSMAPGSPTMPQTVYQPDVDEVTAIDQFRKTIMRMRDHKGPVFPSPLFGAMDLESAHRLQFIHCAHHLGLLVPRDAKAV